MYERFEQLCEEKGVTPYRVAKETGITTATLSNWKAGRYRPKADKLLAIANYFGVSYSYLLGLSDVKYAPKSIGDRIKARRLELGLSEEELAARLEGSTHADITTIEDYGEVLTTTRIDKLADALETNVSWLMGWTEDNSPNHPTPDAIKDNIDILSKKIDTTVYYDNEKTAALMQKLLEDKYMKLLFDAAKDSKPADIEMAAEMLRRLKGTNENG